MPQEARTLLVKRPLPATRSATGIESGGDAGKGQRQASMAIPDGRRRCQTPVTAKQAA